MGIVFSSLPCLLRQARALLPQFPSAKTTPPQALLPNDVVFDILSRIPVKSLCRFKCVSKEWHALMSDPAFVAAHKSLADPLLVVGSREGESLWLIDVDGDVVKVIHDVGPVSELICTSRDNLVCVITHSGDVKVVDLANGVVLLTTCQRDGMLGFGCTISSNVYKMIYFDVDNTCEILTVGDGVVWRPMPPPPTSNISYSSDPVVVNGVMHVMLESQLDGNNVMCFDLASEEWKKGIKGPPAPDVGLQPCEPALSELNGSLCMVQRVVMGWDRWTNIWLLANSDTSTWVKVYTIHLDSSWFRFIPLMVLHDNQRMLFCNSRETSTVEIYDPRRWMSTYAPNALFDTYDTNFSPCSLHLESFVLAKR